MKTDKHPLLATILCRWVYEYNNSINAPTEVKNTLKQKK